MFRPKLLLFFNLLFSIPLFAVTYTWVGTTNDWNTAANWSPAVVPGAADEAVFLSGSAVYPTTNVGAAVSVNEITFTSSVPNAIAIGPYSGGLTLAPVALASSITSSGGTNTVNGDLTIAMGTLSTTFTASAGILSFPGNITCAGDALSLIGSGGFIELGGTNSWTAVVSELAIGGNVLVSSLGAFGTGLGGSPPSQILMSLANLFIGVEGFTITAAAPITLSGACTFNTQGFNATIESVISGIGAALIKNGLGTLTLTGANTYSGGTTVLVGALQGNTSSLQGNIDVSAGANVIFNQTVSIPPNIYSGTLSGAGTVTKTGAATVIFSGTNTYSGATEVNAGTLQAGSTPQAFGINSPVSVASGATLFLSTFPNTIGSLTGPTGSLVNLGSTTLSINNGGNFSGVISGAPGNLTLNGGALTLGGVNTYSGVTLVNNGAILNISADANLGTSVLQLANGSTLQAGASFTLARAISLLGGTANIDSNGNTLTISGQITNVGGLNKIGADTLILTHSTNLYSGGTTITAGTLQISADGNVGSGAISILNGATLEAGTSFTLTKAVTLTGIANIDTNGATLQMGGAIGGSGTLSKIGNGTLTLTNAANSYLGGTVLNTGILNISADGNLGAATGQLTLLGETTLLAGASFSLNANRPVFLGAGTVTIDSSGFNPTIDGAISGPGLLFKEGVGSLTLSHANSYSGGTTINEGTLIISQDSNLGLSAPLTITGGTTLQAAGSFALAADRIVNLSGGISIIDTGAFSPSIAGTIMGIGTLQKNGAGTLTLTGTNSYSGGTIVNAGTLQGTTSSLQGNIQVAGGATLQFNQASSGTYSGILTGSGALNILGGGNVTVSGSSPSFSGITTISGNSTLNVTGSLASSQVTISSGSTLTGTGTVGTITNAGTITPGALGSGTLNVNGDLSFTSSGRLLTQMTPTTTALLALTGTANLANGTSQIELAPGFYGINGVRTILTAGVVNGPFANLILDPRLQGFLVYNPTNVQLVFQVINPFLGFDFANANERAVGQNLDALQAAGELSADLETVIDALNGLSVADINNALDQMHPAAFGAFAEMQTELGGQLLSLFHRPPSFSCGCNRATRLWVLPFGNWLHEKKQGEQIGFHATTRGVALGLDHQFFHSWTLGIGGAYSASDLSWSLGRGYAYIESGYVSMYSDLFVGNFFLGLSGYGGKDFYDAHRHIHFSSIDRQASSHFNGIDGGAQIRMAYYFGTPSFQLYPYATADYLYLKNQSFQESGADSLNLRVESYTSSTLRATAGGALSFVDRNPNGTFCIAPMISMGYVLELPLHRDHFHARFEGTSIPFTTTGWDMAWQLLNLQTGLKISYRCLSLNSTYSADISPEGDSPFFNQRANFELSLSF